MRLHQAPLFCAALLCASPSAGAEPPPASMDARILEPHLIDIGAGRRLNFTCVGQGAPTVVFEQGGEGLVYNWRKVQPSITAITRTCFYDRAGFGFSDPPDKPVTGVNVTDDLRRLLRKAKVKGPVVLVGHSIGGFYATLYADRFPSKVAGLVLVDPGFAGQWPALSPQSMRTREEATRRGGESYLHCGQLARQGKLSKDAPQGCFEIPPGLTSAEAAYFLNANTRPWWYEAEIDQSNNYFPYRSDTSESWRQEQSAHRLFGDLPMAVLSAERVAGNGWESDADQEVFRQWWRAGHQDLARRSTHGEWGLVPDSGHFIQRDRPDIVIAAITRVVRRAREHPRK